LGFCTETPAAVVVASTEFSVWTAALVAAAVVLAGQALTLEVLQHQVKGTTVDKVRLLPLTSPLAVEVAQVR
jgi:hypothetical protein